jgi:hypothetical protein
MPGREMCVLQESALGGYSVPVYDPTPKFRVRLFLVRARVTSSGKQTVLGIKRSPFEGGFRGMNGNKQ